jgi:hypothetical protein
MPIETGAAVKAATSFLHTLYGQGITPIVEEIEYDATGPAWLITLSFYRNDPQPQSTFGMVLAPARLYKSVRVNADSGAIESMKIRAAGI